LFAVITGIEKGSPAAGTKLMPGDKLIAVNGRPVNDVLDYKFFTYEERLIIEAQSPDGKIKLVRIHKDLGRDIGLEFETYLMDKAHSCANRCIFCFVDQLPRGMRRTLYFKDDDARLSFLLGNYITLTNLSEKEAQRIIDLHISPINVSVHTTNPELRKLMLGNPRGGSSLDIMRRFAEAGITMNCQIVCCPGINDGAELDRSMRDLTDMYPSVNSVSIVPVGLTKHRERLYKLTPFDRELALKTVRQVEEFTEGCLEKYGTRIFFCGDELYLKAGLELPDSDFYEDYPQLENGVGMMRLLITEFESALDACSELPHDPPPFSIATGVSAAPFMEMLYNKAKEKFPVLDGRVYPIVNDFFGHTIDVAGLVTGGDLIRQLRGKPLGETLLIPQNMLRHGEGVFLDDVTLEDAERELGIKVRPTEQDGGKLFEAMIGSKEVEE
jgi:putative radical SAM enzyme (TIGR03279 family)